jgi:hypothetical protein
MHRTLPHCPCPEKREVHDGCGVCRNVKKAELTPVWRLQSSPSVIADPRDRLHASSSRKVSWRAARR